jgi:hypothetical protein
LWVSCALGVQQRDILIGGLICVVTWFTNNHEIWSDNNITIPVIVGSWVLSWLLLHSLIFSMPDSFYRLLVPDAQHKNKSENDA